MQFKALCLLFFAVVTLAAPENGKRQDVDPASYSTLLAELADKITIPGSIALPTTMPTCLGGFDAPNPTLARMMLTALPASILGEIGNANSRKALASKFKAGETPDWFKNLNPAIRSYVASVQTHATTACTVTPSPAFGATGETSGANGDGVASSTSKAQAARPTAAVVGGVSGVLGILGLLVVL